MTEYPFTTTSIVDDLPLYGRNFTAENPVAVLSLVHGLGEHSVRYEHFAKWMNDNNISVHLIDLRGHGQSLGPRGGAKDIQVMLDDVAALTEYTRNSSPDIPHFLMGHSMGGLLALAFALQRPMDGIKGVISQAPALSPVSPPPDLQVSILKVIRSFWPGFTASNGLDVNAISKDAEIVRAYVEDPLVHNKISAGLGLGLLETGTQTLASAKTWEKPLLLLHGEADSITSAKASREFARQVGDKCTLELIPDGFHEIHNDPNRIEIYEKIRTWITNRV